MNPTDPVTPGIYLLAIVLMVLAIILYVGSLRWVYRDAVARGKSGFLVALLVAFTNWPLSLVAWLVFRPEKRRDGNLDGLLRR